MVCDLLGSFTSNHPPSNLGLAQLLLLTLDGSRAQTYTGFVVVTWDDECASRS